MSEYPLVDTENRLEQLRFSSSVFDEGRRSAAAAAAMATGEEDQRNEAAATTTTVVVGEVEEECVYKTKVIQFLGRTTPIILQNDNGPCPLLAICNVLLLKNNLNLGVDISEVSVKNLLHLVGERIIDSNSNVENKDVGYTQNQEQNMGDALDLLPRLSTGIDVNLQFKRIDDFEFTPECAIFDLLDIPLYHGWIVDPQDCDTAEAIGSKSYNTLMGELVALETKTTVEEQKSNPEEDTIDFAAATTATLGVPSPSLGRAISFDDSSLSISCPQGGKGDVEEEVELLRALKLSSVECQTSVDKSNNTCVSSEENTHPKGSDSGVPADTLEGHLCTEQQILHLPDLSVSPMPDLSVSHNCDASSGYSNEMPSLETVSRKTNNSFMEITAGNHSDQSSSKEFGEIDFIDNAKSDALVQSQREDVLFSNENSLSDEGRIHGSEGDQQFKLTCHQDTFGFDNQSACDSTMFSSPSAQNVESDSSGGRNHDTYVQEDVNSSLNNSEPMYEGEECILDAGPPVYETREAVYEGEMALTEQADISAGGACTRPEGDLIRSFLRNNASQLTIYGLFCLQEGLKERELCVFFRNNHFSTMFKLNGELYLLATDQGYIHQPDLVWEKLNEVNGDTVFMTSNFTEFKLESHGNITWDEQNVMTSTVDYLASMDTSTPADSTLNSDMQLAMALQQQEYDNQQQPPRKLQQPSSGGSGSRLVVGPPQGTRRPASTSNSSSRQDGKSKDKCTVM